MKANNIIPSAVLFCSCVLSQFWTSDGQMWGHNSRQPLGGVCPAVLCCCILPQNTAEAVPRCLHCTHVCPKAVAAEVLQLRCNVANLSLQKGGFFLHRLPSKSCLFSLLTSEKYQHYSTQKHYLPLCWKMGLHTFLDGIIIPPRLLCGSSCASEIFAVSSRSIASSCSVYFEQLMSRLHLTLFYPMEAVREEVSFHNLLLDFLLFFFFLINNDMV